MLEFMAFLRGLLAYIGLAVFSLFVSADTGRVDPRACVALGLVLWAVSAITGVAVWVVMGGDSCL